MFEISLYGWEDVVSNRRQHGRSFQDDRREMIVETGTTFIDDRTKTFLTRQPMLPLLVFNRLVFCQRNHQ